MKQLIYLLLISTAVFSQNYNYAVKKTQKNTPLVAPVSNNQLEEIEYFNAYLLPLAQKANLQNALNTHRAVRLEAGNYKDGGLGRITLSSNMKLYGHSSYNEMPEINIAAGATNVLVTSVKLWHGLNFLSGGAITNCTISHVSGGDISATNASIENCTFVDIIGSNLNINNVSSGYFRNNKIIKHWITSVYPQLFLKGNSTTPSYNNTWAWLNLLTPHGDATDIDSFGSLNILGLDAEAWNYKNLGTGKALLYMRNMTDVKLASIAGNGYAQNSSAIFDIEANNLTILDKKITTNGVASVTTAKTITINSNSSPYSVTGGNYDIRGYFNDGLLSYNGSSQTSSMTGIPASNITASVLSPKRQEWSRPIFAEIGNPTGENWKLDRAGKPSSRTYIQGLIDANGIANLPEGIFYIDAPLLVNKEEGIVGSGTGKTVIVGLTDDFNLINVRGTGIGSFTLNYLTLQGGSKGVNITSDGLDVWFQPNGINVKYVVFRNQATCGIEVAQLYGMDNCMFEQVHFFNIPIGFKQTPDPNYSGGESNRMTYIDKTVFYNCQAIKCGIGFSLRTARANNLNAWINCNFDGNTVTSIDFINHNAPLVVNCNFKNNSGSSIINSGYTIGLYSCSFSNNSTKAIIKGDLATIEGCNFLDNIPLFETSRTAHILNSTVAGSTKNMSAGMIINSNLLADPSLSKLLINVKAGVPNLILEETSKPYPQFLVTN